MSTCRASVLMPVYNAWPYLQKATASVLAQSFGDFEFIIVNDGSTDRSTEYLAELAVRDHRIRLVQHHRTDLAAVRNELQRLAAGEFLVWADADDVSRPDRIEKQIRYLDAHQDCVCVGSWALATDFAGRPLRTLKPPTEHEEIDRQHLLGEGGGVLNPSACMRRSAVQEVGGFRDQFPPSEDFDLLLRLAEIGCLANLPEVLVEYRLHAQSATFQRREEMITHAHLALIEACTRRKIEAPDDAVLQTHLDLGPGDLDLLWARWANKDRFFSTARLYASKSVRNDIRDFARWRELAIALFPPPISNRPFGRLFLKPAIGFARWSFLTMAHAIARPTSGSSSLT